jgi:hypothetical protein
MVAVVRSSAPVRMVAPPDSREEATVFSTWRRANRNGLIIVPPIITRYGCPPERISYWMALVS